MAGLPESRSPAFHRPLLCPRPLSTVLTQRPSRGWALPAAPVQFLEASLLCERRYRQELGPGTNRTLQPGLYLFIYLFLKLDMWHFKFIYLFIYLFIFGCVGSSFLCESFLLLWRAGATLHRGARASHYRGLSCGAQAPDAQAQ